MEAGWSTEQGQHLADGEVRAAPRVKRYRSRLTRGGITAS
jgi:hypothetical protein